MRRIVIFTTVLAVLISTGILHKTRVGAAMFQAGNWTTGECDKGEGNTHNHWMFGYQDRVCQLRTTTIRLGGQQLGVSSENGGIQVIGEDRKDVAIEAMVQAWAGSESEANDILRQVQIDTSGDRIRDHGPHFHMGNKGYGINYKLHVPRQLSVDLESTNGGIDIAHLEGHLRFNTTNGGVKLTDLAGDVGGQTTNGGVEIALSGDHWQGTGLRAETTNGGVHLKVPDKYSAHLEAGTTNGGIHIDFPVMVQGSIKSHLSTDLGNGGPTIHTETTNGGISITRIETM
jgi:DUF4097 and DUF4098 domain-containing protein YvlB